MFDRFLRFILKFVMFLLFAILLFYLFQRAYEIGYAVFADEPYKRPEMATESIITVREDESLLDIARDLERNGIVKNAYVTAIAFRTMEGYDRIRPGEYILKSSMKPSEIMKTFVGKDEEDHVPR